MFARTTGKTCVRKLPYFPYLVLTHIIKGGGKYLYCPGYFLCCHVFPMVSELDYSQLKSVVIIDDLEFCLREMLRQGGSYTFLVVFISIETSTVLITVQY